jgi:putative flippase GtrA
MKELLSYCLIGGSCVLLDLLSYSALVNLGIHHQIANAAGYGLGTLISFALNRSITFKVRDKTVARLAIFSSVAGIGYIASIALLFLLVDHLGVSPIAGKIATLPVVVVLQFTLNKFITWRAQD